MKTCGLIMGVIFAAAMSIAPGLQAHQGMVETRDGKTVTGQVQFDTNQLVVVNADEGIRVTIALSDLLGASFQAQSRTGGNSSPEETKEIFPLGALPEPWQSVTIFPEPELPPEEVNPKPQSNAGGLRISKVAPVLVEQPSPAPSTSNVLRAGFSARAIRPQARFLYGVYQVDTAGTNISGTADSFHYVFKTVKGDTEMMVRVLHVPNTSRSARAGLMIRENLRSDSPNIFVGLKPGAGGVMQWRDTSGGETTVVDTRAISVPFWLKLKRSGNTITASISRSGRQWRVLQSMEAPLPEDIYIGLAVAGLPQGELRSPTLPGETGRVVLPEYQHCSFDQVREAPFLPSWFVPRIELQNGSMVVGRIASADDQRIVFEGGALAAEPLPTPSVASILFQWVPTKSQTFFDAGRAGVILAGGEFVEGEFRGIQTGRLKLSSVLQGLRTYDMADDLMALVLRKPLVVPQPFEVQTADGSVWIGEKLEMRNNSITLDAGAAGVRTFQLLDLRSIRRMQ